MNSPIPASSLIVQEAVEALISPWSCSLFPKCGDFPLTFFLSILFSFHKIDEQSLSSTLRFGLQRKKTNTTTKTFTSYFRTQNILKFCCQIIHGHHCTTENIHVLCAKSLSRVWLFVTLRTIDRQAPLPMGFSRHEQWGGLPCPPPGDLPDQGTHLGSSSLGKLEKRALNVFGKKMISIASWVKKRK